MGAYDVLLLFYAKVFQSDRILRSTNGIIYQIISSLTESMGECLALRDCKDLLFWLCVCCFSLGLFYHRRPKLTLRGKSVM